MALSGLEEFAIAPTERPRAWTVAFLSGSTQPRICGGKLLLPKVNESGGGGDEKVALFCFREREKERESVFTFFSQQVSAKEKEVNERKDGIKRWKGVVVILRGGGGEKARVSKRRPLPNRASPVSPVQETWDGFLP